MKKLSRVKLSSLFQEDLADREMNALRGGHTCGCACKTAEKATNHSANEDSDYHSPSGNIVCTWTTISPPSTTAGGAIVNGGSKAPDMP